MARTTDLNPNTHTAVVEALRQGLTRAAAASCAGISSRTLRLWMERGRSGEEPYQQLLLDIQLAEANIEKVLTLSILKAATGTDDKIDDKGNIIRRGRPGDYKAAAFYLERRRPEYRQKTEVNIDGALERLLDVVEQICGPEKTEQILARYLEGEGSGKAEGIPSAEDSRAADS